MSWSKYVTGVAPNAPQKEVAAAAKVDGSTVSRWKSGLAPKPENVAAFARAYNRPVLEAFVAAGFLTREEAGEKPSGRPRMADLSNDELLAEISKRINQAGDYELAARHEDPDVGPDDIEHTT